MDKNIRILIVEDDFTVSEEVLCRLIETGYEIVGTVFSAKKAFELLENRHVDIVLIDTNLKGDLDGFELAESIKIDYKLPFIFLADADVYDYLDRAKQANPSSILLQPYCSHQMQISIEIAIENFFNSDINRGKPIEHQRKKQSVNSLTRCLFFKKDNHFERVELDDIFWLKAESNYTLIHTQRGEYVYSTVLKSFEEKLPSDQFMRVHRSFIINLAKIETLEGEMVMIDNQRIPIARSCRDKVFKILQVI